MNARVISTDAPERRLAVVILTRNHRAAVLATLARLTALEAPFAICVVDNGSNDGTADAIASRFGGVQLVRLPRNMGAAARNFGVREVSAHYVAFCDDNACWAEGALSRAIAIMDAFPKLGVISAQLLSDAEARGRALTRTPTKSLDGVLPGIEVASFSAGACVMRRNAFLAAGGYEPRLFFGGEEGLLAMDMQARGWRLAYIPELVLRRSGAQIAGDGGQHMLLQNSLRNALWCAWLRRPIASACRETWRQLARVVHDPHLAPGLLDALRGAPWVWRQRKVLPVEVERKLQRMEKGNAFRKAC